MGTLFHFHFYASSPELAESALQAAIARVEEINQIASDYLPQSELSRVNLAPAHQPIPLSNDLYKLLQRSIEISALTEGAFDITAAHSIQNWRRAKRQKKLPSPAQTAKALSLTNWQALQLDFQSHTLTKTAANLLLDLGGIAKGYAADAALTVLKEKGISRALVAASGDFAIGDPPPGEVGWPVSTKLFDAQHSHHVSPELHLSNCAISTSGDLHQFVELDGKRYSHIVDPRTALGLTTRIACSVITTKATDSDALATAACVLGPEKTKALFSKVSDLSCYLVQLPDQVVIQGPAFPLRPSTP